MTRLIALILLILSPLVLAADEFTDDVRRLAPAIGLGPGQTIADIGAGGGELTMALAKEVGPTGRVFATEINSERRDHIRQRAADAGLSQVTVVDAEATRTNLPPACCDAIVIRFVYHHFGDPQAMDRSIFESVKPGGHVVVIDFLPRHGTTASPSQRAAASSHGVDPETITKEMTAAGFARVSVTSGDERGFMVVLRKPN